MIEEGVYPQSARATPTSFELDKLLSTMKLQRPANVTQVSNAAGKGLYSLEAPSQRSHLLKDHLRKAVGSADATRNTSTTLSMENAEACKI